MNSARRFPELHQNFERIKEASKARPALVMTAMTLKAKIADLESHVVKTPDDPLIENRHQGLLQNAKLILLNSERSPKIVLAGTRPVVRDGQLISESDIARQIDHRASEYDEDLEAARGRTPSPADAFPDALVQGAVNELYQQTNLSNSSRIMRARRLQTHSINGWIQLETNSTSATISVTERVLNRYKIVWKFLLLDRKTPLMTSANLKKIAKDFLNGGIHALAQIDRNKSRPQAPIETTFLIEQIIKGNPESSARQISKLLLQKHDIKLSHVSVQRYLNRRQIVKK